MSTNKIIESPKNTFLSWEFFILKVILFGILAVMLDKPVGSVTGQIALEKESSGLYSYNIRQNKVFAVASGPRDGNTITRGAWVDDDGNFKIEQLPVGEYSIRVQAKGFSTAYVNSVMIEDGKIAAITPAIKMAALEPYISIASNTRVFTTSERPRFWVNATGATEATVKIYKKKFQDFVASEPMKQAGVEVSSDLSMYTTYNKKFHNPYSDESPVVQRKRELVSDYTDSARADFKLDEKFEPGDYVVVAEAVDVSGKKRTSSIWWFSVTDLGLVVKHSPDQSLVRAVNLKTLKPVADVSVSLFERESNSGLTRLAEGKTGPDGILLLEGLKRSTYNPVVIGSIGGFTAYGAAGYWEGQDRHYSTYFYSDRPVYRLGQTVYYKAIMRELAASGFKRLDPQTAIQVTIEDPDNTRLVDETLYMSGHGTVNGKFTIPENGKTGAYQLTLNYPDGGTSYQAIEVAQYRKPEYKVEIIPGTTRTTAGSKVKAKVRATYFFGGPVANARVKYSVYSSPDWTKRYNLEPRPEYYSFYDSWSDEGEDYEYQYDYGGSLVTEGFAQTGEAGEAEIEFDTSPISSVRNSPYFYNDYQDKNYKIEAEVTDISRLTVTASASTLVTSGDYVVFVNPSSWVVKVGESIGAEVLVLDYDGKPVANKAVDVTLSRWPWDAATHEHRDEQILLGQTINTDEKGRARLTFASSKQWPTDTFYISASVKNNSGAMSCSGDSVWIASDRIQLYLGSEKAEREPFKITLDKKVYQPGETARAVVSGPFKGDEGYTALVSIEGTRIHSYRTIPLSSSAALVEIPIKSEYGPNVFVNVSMVAGKKQFYNQTQSILVSPECHFMSIAIKSDKEKYKPGETVRYKLKATDRDGKPVPNAELSLGVVDESIYSIRGDATPDIQKFFFRKRENWVVTLSSFPEQYSGGPDKIEPKLRKNFKDTAAWLPELVTDARGEVTASVQLPDNLTTWRATVRGITAGVDVGAQVQKVLVTQDIIARLALPRFYTRGDVSEIGAVVHNYSNQNQEVTLTLTPSSQFKSKEALVRKLNVEKDKAASYSWPIEVIGTGDATVQLKAVGQTAGDYLERALPVRAFGLPIANVDSGVLNQDRRSYTVPFRITPDMESPKLSLSLSGSTISQVRGSFSSLIDYPYGCTEQTMSRLMPSTIAMQLNKRLGMPLPKEDMTRFDAVYQKGMARLKELRHGDGGWGWWQDDQTNPYLTALVLEGFKELKDSGYAVESYLIDEGLKRLEADSKDLAKLLDDPKLLENYTSREKRLDLARVAYTLSIYGKKPDKKVMAYLESRVKTAQPEYLAYLAMIQMNTGARDAARSTAAMLAALANKTASTEDWEHTKEMLARLKVTGVTDYTYRYTGVESTALALRAVLAVEPDMSDRIERIKTWLLLHRSKDGWSNTKTTAEVLRALIAEALAFQSADRTELIAQILKGTSPLKQLAFSPSELYSTEKNIDLPLADLSSGLKVDLTTTGRLYYRSLLSYFKTLKPNENLDAYGAPGGLKVRRSFFKLETAGTVSSGNLKLKTVPLTGPVKAGETLLMKVYVESPMSLPYVILEAPLPSGGEVVESRGQEENLSGEDGGSVIEGDWGAPWWTHQDVLDDRIVFFGTEIPQGKSEFHTLVRMELPGRFQLNPVKLEGMYTDLIKGHSTPLELSVTP